MRRGHRAARNSQERQLLGPFFSTFIEPPPRLLRRRLSRNFPGGLVNPLVSRAPIFLGLANPYVHVLAEIDIFPHFQLRGCISPAISIVLPSYARGGCIKYACFFVAEVKLVVVPKDACGAKQRSTRSPIGCRRGSEQNENKS